MYINIWKSFFVMKDYKSYGVNCQERNLKYRKSLGGWKCLHMKVTVHNMFSLHNFLFRSVILNTVGLTEFSCIHTYCKTELT